ncbi:hypothetical protein OEZ85_011050 [Tetradesmus obliquus]|uniref:Glycosyl transferase family 1 domain-containing protein n=1 Tax=Tetradesmus obliquus TaxID=3088 RepID=A0ABY8TP37_TETOB|nr:hypothetical protein OEZ85_011050 [Tetradesmus obliquus]
MKIAAVQDFPMAAPAWLDANTSVSWLRAFERMAAEGGHEAHAIMREHNYEYTMSRPIRGIHYVFTRGHEKFAGILHKIRPDVVMYNNCCYARLPGLMKAVRQLLPDAVQVVRTHHEVKRVLPRPLLAEVLANADHMIVSTEADWEYISTTTPAPLQHSIIPFGVDVPYFLARPPCARTTDFSASCSGNPVKNLPLLKRVFAELASRGYTTQNILGQPREQYAQQLCSTKVYFSPSTSEASGSRSLLEAYACGAYPVVAAACASACEVVSKLGRGQAVDDERTMADVLEAALLSAEAARACDLTQLNKCYSQQQEIPLETVLDDGLIGFYCNAWLARPALFAEYGAFLQACIHHMETDAELKHLLCAHSPTYSSKVRADDGATPLQYTMHPFVLERLPPLFFKMRAATVYMPQLQA